MDGGSGGMQPDQFPNPPDSMPPQGGKNISNKSLFVNIFQLARSEISKQIAHLWIKILC